LFILTVISFVVTAAVIGAVAAVGLTILLSSGLMSAGVIQDSTALPIMVTVTCITFLVLLALLAIFNIAIGNAQILVIDAHKDPSSLTTLIKGGYRVAVPMLLTGLLGGLLIIGGFFVFIVPAWLFMFLFSFSAYAVVLDGYGPIPALRRSIALVSSHFWSVFTRIVLLYVIYFFVSYLFPKVLGLVSGDFNLLVQGLSFVADVVLGWYMLAYTLTLYKQIRATSGNEQGSLKWLVLTALIGWGLIVLLSIGMFRFVQSDVFKKYSEDFTESIRKNIQQEDKNFQAPELDFYNTEIPSETPSFPTSESI